MVGDRAQVQLWWHPVLGTCTPLAPARHAQPQGPGRAGKSKLKDRTQVPDPRGLGRRGRRTARHTCQEPAADESGARFHLETGRGRTPCLTRLSGPLGLFPDEESP